MKSKFTLLIIFLIYGYKVNAQVNWADNIAPVIYKNCSYCHNSVGIAPFELMSYYDAVDNANDIVDAVQNKTMPPWPPDPNYHRLAYERILSQQEINDITDWVNNGMARGDSTLEPAPPVFNQTAQISNPDAIFSAPVYTVNTGSSDLYRNFVIPTNFSVTQFLTAIEAVPGNRSIVHHVLIYSDSTNVPATLDAQDPGPGYTNLSGTGSQASKLIGAWVPGQSPYYTPNGMGISLPANSSIVVQIHYPEGLTNEIDSTKLYLKLSTAPLREISINTPLNHYQLDNGWLIIPANTVQTFTAHYTVPVDLSVLSVGPHMHLIGKSIRSWGITPSNDTIPFIDVPNWDFHWQGYYAFRNVIKIPAGTVLHSTATYDNTTNNPHNPSNPPQLVTLGEATTDEMMLVYFSYTPYQSGDEYIVIDSTLLNTSTQEIPNSIVSTLQLYELVPNPASDNLSFQYFVPKNGTVKISVLDMHGKMVSENSLGLAAGISTSKIDVDGLASGIYFLRLENEGVARVKKFVVE